MDRHPSWPLSLGCGPFRVPEAAFEHLDFPRGGWLRLSAVVWGGRIFPGVPVDISGGKGPKEEGPLPWFFFQSLILMGEGLSGVSG